MSRPVEEGRRGGEMGKGKVLLLILGQLSPSSLLQRLGASHASFKLHKDFVPVSHITSHGSRAAAANAVCPAVCAQLSEGPGHRAAVVSGVMCCHAALEGCRIACYLNTEVGWVGLMETRRAVRSSPLLSPTQSIFKRPMLSCLCK